MICSLVVGKSLAVSGFFIILQCELLSCYFVLSRPLQASCLLVPQKFLGFNRGFLLYCKR